MIDEDTKRVCFVLARHVAQWLRDIDVLVLLAESCPVYLFPACLSRGLSVAESRLPECDALCGERVVFEAAVRLRLFEVAKWVAPRLALKEDLCKSRLPGDGDIIPQSVVRRLSRPQLASALAIACANDDGTVSFPSWIVARFGLAPLDVAADDCDALWWAVASKKAAAVSFLLSAAGVFMPSQARMEELVRIACCVGATDVARILCDSGFAKGATTSLWESALIVTVGQKGYCSTEAIAFICDRCPSLAPVAVSAAFDGACRMGDVQLAKYILDRYHSSVGRSFQLRVQSLNLASRGGHEEMVKWLLSLVNRGEENAIRLTSPMMKALSRGHYGIAELLYSMSGAQGEQPAPTPAMLQDMLLTATKHGLVQSAEWVIGKWPFPDASRFASWSLSVACRRGHTEMVAWLFDHFPFASDATAGGDARNILREYLGRACKHGHLSTAMTIAERLQLTADDFRWNDNESFVFACMSGDLELAQWIASFGMTKDDACCWNNVAFCGVCRGGYLHVAEWMRERFSLTKDDGLSKGNYPLFAAAQSGHLKMVKWIVNRFGLTADDVRSQNNRAFRAACSSGYVNVARWLAESFELGTSDAMSNGGDAFLSACKNGHLPVAQFLATQFSIKPTNCGCDCVPLIAACAEAGHVNIVRWLCDSFDIRRNIAAARQTITESPRNMRVVAFIDSYLRRIPGIPVHQRQDSQ